MLAWIDDKLNRTISLLAFQLFLHFIGVQPMKSFFHSVRFGQTAFITEQLRISSPSVNLGQTFHLDSIRQRHRVQSKT